ncbi:hypothetical protein [Streptomyces graminilatus]|uniref:hypothetical protein n=1 Tax=Streptomyces graminilatus TaxID=1464070 RepID=UPI000A770D76|nr:hypothetical protein [Streptomyces graminilatus]
MTAPAQRPLDASHIALNVLLAGRTSWVPDITTSLRSDWATTDTDWFLSRDDLDDPAVYPAMISVDTQSERITLTHTRACGHHPLFDQRAAETAIPLTPRGIEHLRHLLPSVERHGLPTTAA